MAEPIYSEIYRCKKDSGTFVPNSPYKTNLISALKKLPSLKSASVGDKPSEKVIAIALCAGYLNPKDCASCLNKTIPLLLQKCPNQKGAAAWRVKCMVLYDTPGVNNFHDWFVAHEVSEMKAKDAVGLQASLSILGRTLFGNVKDGRPTRYAYGTQPYRDQTLHMVMQCTNQISNNDCYNCLSRSIKEINTCCSGAIAVAILTPNCYLRYAHSDFRVL